jgi:hypothetical protein
MPSPCPNPYPNEINTDARDQPNIICLLYGTPKLIEFQTAQSEPYEKHADQHAQPELPFFHGWDFIMRQSPD